MQKSSSFRELVYAVVRQIPKGKTLTYKQVAKMAGRPKAYRAVGNILNKNYNPEVPCHRVVKSDGTLGGYNRGEAQKALKLNAESAHFHTHSKKIDSQGLGAIS